MKLLIRQEQPSDHSKVFNLVEKAFSNEKMSDHKEQFLVERLRKSNAFITKLSLIAEYDHKVVGYILLTKVKIKNVISTYESLALAPVCVLPEFQGKRIESQLIEKAHEIATSLGFGTIMLLGHEAYYPKFGYLKAKDFEIKFPFEAPSENCKVKELKDRELTKINGIVVYPKEFFK